MMSNPSSNRRRATTIVETGLVLTAFLLFLFAIFEFGRFIMLRDLLDNAAREGARQAIANTNTLATSDIQNIVTSYLAGQPINVTSFNVYEVNPTTGANIGPWTNAQFGQQIAVDVQASYTPLLPTFGILPNPVIMHSKVIMCSEAN
jgi:Flp pilus assembly protein TadG